MRIDKDSVTSPNITRFAPSPTGYLHLGHVLSALYVCAVAKLKNAKIILRIEDHDRVRSKKHFEEVLLSDLDWLGFSPDDGVSSVNQPSKFRQSDHLDRYQNYLQSLLTKEQMVYGCACSRKEIKLRNSTSDSSAQPVDRGQTELPYDGHCRELGKSFLQPGAELANNLGYRLVLPKQEMKIKKSFTDLFCGPCEQTPQDQGDDLLIRDKIQNWTYQFAVVCDDLAEQINWVVRGEDLLSSTGRQIQLRQQLTPDESISFAHHPLLYSTGQIKLSKQDQALRAACQRDHQGSPDGVIAAALKAGQIPSPGHALNWVNAVELLACFIASTP